MCSSCKRRFTTYERVEESAPMVVKKDNRREPFDRAKIVSGLKKACETPGLDGNDRADCRPDRGRGAEQGGREVRAPLSAARS